MGSVAFIVPPSPSAALAACLHSAALAGGYDMAPAPTRRTLDKDRLTLTKDANESGFLLVPWPMATGRSEICLSTTLRERAEPYHLLVELARGKVNQVRCQAAEWDAIGLSVEPQDRLELRALTRRFGEAVLAPDHASAPGFALDALNRANAAGERLSASFADQLLLTRVGENGPLETRLDCTLSQVPPPDQRAAFAATFTSVKLVPDWSRVEPRRADYDWAAFDELVTWAFAAGLDVTIGPVIDLADGRFPAWVVNAAGGEYADLADALCGFAEAVLRRYQERVRSWQICSGFNHQDAFGLGEDDRLRLAARIMEAARTVDADCSWILGIAQPWGDYLTAEDHTYSPLVFADNLVRAGFQFSAVELEVLTGDHPRASVPRDAIGLYRLVVLFELLSLPLEVTFGGYAGKGDGQRPDAHLETPVALALALPQVRAVRFDLADATGTRDGRMHSESLRACLKDLRVRYLA